MEFFEKRKEINNRADQYAEAVKISLIEDYDFRPATAEMIVKKFGVAKFVRNEPLMLNTDPRKFAGLMLDRLAGLFEKMSEQD